MGVVVCFQVWHLSEIPLLADHMTVLKNEPEWKQVSYVFSLMFRGAISETGYPENCVLGSQGRLSRAQAAPASSEP